MCVATDLEYAHIICSLEFNNQDRNLSSNLLEIDSKMRYMDERNKDGGKLRQSFRFHFQMIVRELGANCHFGSANIYWD